MALGFYLKNKYYLKYIQIAANASLGKNQSGGGEIRTLGTDFHPYTGLANQRTRPALRPLHIVARENCTK